MKARSDLKKRLDGIEHMHYHKVPCPCPDIKPEIEQTENFLEEHNDKIAPDMKLLLNRSIDMVNQAIANHKDIKEAKEALALQLKYVQKATLNLDNGITLDG